MIQIQRWAWGLAALAALVGCKEERRAGTSAVPVTVAKAEQRTVPFEVSAPGTVEPVRAVAVTAQVSGLVTGVRFREGDLVEAGQVLVEIDPRPYRNALQQAEATLARDLIQLDNAVARSSAIRGWRRASTSPPSSTRRSRPTPRPWPPPSSPIPRRCPTPVSISTTPPSGPRSRGEPGAC